MTPAWDRWVERLRDMERKGGAMNDGFVIEISTDELRQVLLDKAAEADAAGLADRAGLDRFLAAHLVGTTYRITAADLAHLKTAGAY